MHHDQTKGRIFRSAISPRTKAKHMARLALISKRCWTTTDKGVLTLFWDFVTPAELDRLRGYAVSLVATDPDIGDTVTLLDTVQSL